MKAIASTVIGIVMADVVTGLIDPKEQHQQEQLIQDKEQEDFELTFKTDEEQDEER